MFLCNKSTVKNASQKTRVRVVNTKDWTLCANTISRVRGTTQERTPSFVQEICGQNRLAFVLQLMPRETATVVVKHPVPALRVSIGAKLGVAARVVVEPVDPALGVPHGQFLDVRRRAGRSTSGPAISSLPAVVGNSHPALGHALFSAEDPPGALRLAVAHVDAALNAANGELVRILAVVQETAGGSSKTRDVSKERLPGISYDSVLFDASRPHGVTQSTGDQRREDRYPHFG